MASAWKCLVEISVGTVGATEENALGHLQVWEEATVSKKDLLNFHNPL